MNRSDDWKELLIVEVSKYACLYDVTKESYRNKYIRQNAWKSISEDCDCPIEGSSIAVNRVCVCFCSMQYIAIYLCRILIKFCFPVCLLQYQYF